MKRLLCIHCSDVRALRIGTWTRCRCDRSRARYLDRIPAEVSGKAGLLLAFRNDSLSDTLRREFADRSARLECDRGHEFTASTPHPLLRKPARRRSAP